MMGSMKSQVRAYYAKTSIVPGSLSEAGVHPNELLGKYYTIDNLIVVNADGSFTLRANPIDENDPAGSMRVPVLKGVGDVLWDD